MDHFSLKSLPKTSSVVEKGETNELPVTYLQEDKDLHTLQPSADAVAMKLPPPHSEIDMTVFNRKESATVDMSKFPRINPLKSADYE